MLIGGLQPSVMNNETERTFNNFADVRQRGDWVQQIGQDVVCLPLEVLKELVSEQTGSTWSEKHRIS